MRVRVRAVVGFIVTMVAIFFAVARISSEEALVITVLPF